MTRSNKSGAVIQAETELKEAQVARERVGEAWMTGDVSEEDRAAAIERVEEAHRRLAAAKGLVLGKRRRR